MKWTANISFKNLDNPWTDELLRRNDFPHYFLFLQNVLIFHHSYQMDSLVGVDQWRDRSTGSVAREDTLLWEQTSFNVPIRETGMAPFLRVSKVRVHGSSITLNSTNVALSVNYIIIWVPSGDLPEFVYYFIFTRFCAPLPMPETIFLVLGKFKRYPSLFLFKEPRVICSSQFAWYTTCHRVSFQGNEFLISRFLSKVITLRANMKQSNP